MTHIYGKTYRARYIPIFDKEGNFKHLRRDNNGLLYDKPRKEYTRKKPYPAHITHFKAELRLKSAFIQMRRLGSYSINQMSEASGRSTSYIYNVLKKAYNLRSLHKIDNRKSPRKTILYQCKRKLFSCFEAFKLWEAFILGEEDRPP